MTSLRDFSATILAMQDTLTTPDKWGEALTHIAQFTQMTGATIWTNDFVNDGYAVQFWSTTYADEVISEYFARYGHYDAAAVNQVQTTATPGQIVRDIELWSNETNLPQREDVQFLQGMRASGRCGIRLNETTGWQDMLGLQTDQPWEAVNEPLARTVELLHPHLAKTVETGRTLAILQNKFGAALAALDELEMGFAVVSGDSTVMLMNAAAAQAAEEGDAVYLAAGRRLLAVQERAALYLGSAIRDVAKVADGEGTQAAVYLTCPRRSGGQEMALEVRPFHVRDAQLSGCLVVMIEADKLSSLNEELMRKLFNLSDAETGILGLLACGNTAAGIAEQRDVSPETVKTQIKAINSKVGVTNRANLVRKIVQASPPLRPLAE
ncbi:MAG: helix-turn-helix transcriptional regulator [Pseudomonadota bacterium]